MFFILLLATVLRLHRLGSTSLWFDEAMDLVARNGPFSFSKNLPLYSMFSYLWGKFANSEFILRMPSVIFSTISVLFIYYFTKQIFNRKIGLISAFLLSISPFHIHYAQEFRMYSLLAMLSLMSVYYLRLSLSKGNNKFWFGYVIFNVMAINVHHSALFILFAEIIFFLFYWNEYKPLRIKWMVSNLIIIAFFLFFSIKSIITIISNYLGWWIPPVSGQSILITFKNFSIGYNATPSVYLFACALYFPLFCWGIYQARKNKENLLLLCLCLFCPIIAVGLLSVIWKPYYVDRFFIPSSLFYLILVAKGIAGLRWRFCSMIVLLIIAILTTFSLNNYYLDYLPNSELHHVGVQLKSDTRSVAKYIAENFKEKDIICHADENTVPQIYYYLSPRYKNINKSNEAFIQAKEGIILRFNNISNRVEAQKFCIGEGFIFKKIDVFLEDYERIWFISCRPLEQIESILKYLNKHYIIINIGKILDIKNIIFLELRSLRNNI